MVRSLWVVVAVLTVLVLPGIIHADGEDGAQEGIWESSPTPIPDPGYEAAQPVNTLIVEASTGSITGGSYVGANLTDLTVTGVDASRTGFTLFDAAGTRVFEDQASNSLGSVEFWRVRMMDGTYTVTVLVQHALTGAWTESVVTTFAFTLPIASASSSYQCQRDPTTERCVNQPRTPGDCFPQNYERRIASQTFWTPALIAHAPYGGSTTAAATWTSTKITYIGPVNWESAATHGYRAEPTNGGTIGWFTLATWGYYRVDDGTTCSPHTSYTAKVIDWGASIAQQDLWGSSRQSDADDATSFSRSGRPSLKFEHRYLTQEGTVSVASNGCCVDRSETTVLRAGVQVTFTLSSGSVTIPMTFGEERQSSTGTTYSYAFKPHSTTRYDSYGAMWAFCSC